MSGVVPPGWLEVLGFVAAGLIASGVIWKALVGLWRVARRIGRIHDAIEEKLPLILAEFSPNGGNSLRDRINFIEVKADRAASAAERAVKEAEAARKKVEEFEKYQHKRNHDILALEARIMARESLRDMGEAPHPLTDEEKNA